MIPSVYLELESIPITGNGKIDRANLPDISAKNTLENYYVAPRNAQDEHLVGIWEKLLDRRDIGIEADFFELGGHSLLGIQVVSAIRSELGLEIGIIDLFEKPLN